MNGRMKPSVGRLLDDARFSFAPSGGEDVLRQGLIMLACYAVPRSKVRILHGPPAFPRQHMPPPEQLPRRSPLCYRSLDMGHCDALHLTGAPTP